MKNILLIIFSVFTFSFTSSAQDFLEYLNSNYSGLMGTELQPASVVDSRFKTDFNVLGAGIGLSNNYIGLKKSALKHEGSWNNFSEDNYRAFKDTSFSQNYMVRRESSQNKSVNFYNQIYLPSIMVTINEKNAIAIKWKARTILNIDGLEPDMANLVSNELNYPSLWQKKIENKNLSIQTMSWMEYGITYGHVFKAEGAHFLKAGITAKYVQGLQAAYMYVNDLHYQITNDTTISLFHSDVSYGHSDNFEQDQSTVQYKPSPFGSFAFDFGVVYEWRPKYQDYKYEMNGQKGLNKLDKNKYKLRVGLSVLDVGTPVKFRKGTYSRDFTTDITLWDVARFNPNNLQEFDDSIQRIFIKKKPEGDETFKMSLPTVISLQVDYQLWKDFYVNLTPYIDYNSLKFVKSKRTTAVHELTSISLTPRWDYKYVGLFVPVSYDAYGTTKVGLGLRLGPIIIGTSNILPIVSNKDIYGADIHAMFKIPLMYRRVRDRDNDHVSDDRDRCIDVPGVWEFYGCPDRDNDHVEDKDDQCPDDPGLPEFNGCPDRDGDKVIDKLDACPDVAGLAQFNGCPDTDADGIPDKDDDCPTEYGLKQFKGCPDKDGDGVMDRLDKCPEKPGPASNDGCPELKMILIDSVGNSLRTVIQNKDGSFSFDDLPSDEKVRFRMEGERTDTIFDAKVVVGGIAKKAIKDNRDGYLHFIVLKTDVNVLNQMSTQDVAVKLDTIEQAIVQKAFSNLEFASGNDIIKKESYASLNDLSALLAKKPKWRLKVSGHTDNQGVAAANLKLSQKRSEAVKKYLVGKGIAPERFKVEWFGQTKPIADNKTLEGRQKNRRVEMVIIK
ncbi:MAG: DUF5723 family protein [Bacteroidota bacterium]